MTDQTRRTCDHPDIHPSPCNQLLTHVTLEEELRTDMAEIKETLAEMKEMLTLFKNTKGFVTTIKFIGIAGIGIAAFTGAVAAMLAAIKYWANH